MKHCDYCGKAPNLCSCARIGLEHCGICTRPGPANAFARVDKPNPFGADRGVVFDFYKCKDDKACSEYAASVDWNAVIRESSL